MRRMLILNVRSQLHSSMLLEEKHRDSESAGNSLRFSGGSQKCIKDQENDGKMNWKTETGAGRAETPALRRNIIGSEQILLIGSFRNRLVRPETSEMILCGLHSRAAWRLRRRTPSCCVREVRSRRLTGVHSALVSEVGG